MANEKRLIDANVLNDCFRKEKTAILNHVIDPIKKEIVLIMLHWCEDRVYEAPTVEAVEVKYGRWEDEYGGKYANPRYRCSVCKKRALYKFERDLLGNWKEVQALMPYCPYCMAKLEGGTGNDI